MNLEWFYKKTNVGDKNIPYALSLPWGKRDTITLLMEKEGRGGRVINDLIIHLYMCIKKTKTHLKHKNSIYNLWNPACLNIYKYIVKYMWIVYMNTTVGLYKGDREINHIGGSYNTSNFISNHLDR